MRPAADDLFSGKSQSGRVRVEINLATHSFGLGFGKALIGEAGRCVPQELKDPEGLI
jgi:hypothetical protein